MVTVYNTCILTSWLRAHQGELSQGHLHLRREIPEIRHYLDKILNSNRRITDMVTHII